MGKPSGFFRDKFTSSSSTKLIPELDELRKEVESKGVSYVLE